MYSNLQFNNFDQSLDLDSFDEVQELADDTYYINEFGGLEFTRAIEAGSASYVEVPSLFPFFDKEYKWQ